VSTLGEAKASCTGCQAGNWTASNSQDCIDSFVGEHFHKQLKSMASESEDELQAPSIYRFCLMSFFTTCASPFSPLRAYKIPGFRCRSRSHLIPSRAATCVRTPKTPPVVSGRSHSALESLTGLHSGFPFVTPRYTTAKARGVNTVFL
jgi:hypothetical protein